MRRKAIQFSGAAMRSVCNLLERVEVSGDIARIGFGYSHIGHRRLRADGLRLLNPLEQVFGTILSPGDVRSPGNAIQRRTDGGVRARDTRYRVAGPAAVSLNLFS